MKNLSLRTPPTVAAALMAAAVAACTSSSSGPGATSIDAGADVTTGFSDGGEESSTAEAGEDATADTGTRPGADSGTSPADSGTSVDSGTSSGDSGSPASDSGTVVDSSSPASDGGEPTDGSATCNDIQGTFLATAVSCNGTPISITGVTWILTVNGSDASFSEAINGGCALVSSGGITCSGADFSVLWSNPNTCNPASCSFWGAQCGATPNEWLGWTTSNFTGTTFLATSETEPDGGPTPLTTCRAQGKSDPIQITWTKQ